MLTIHSPRTVLSFVILATLLAGGCSQPVERIFKVQSRQSGERQLRIENESAGRLSVLPARGSEGKPLVIRPGQAVPISFQIFRLADLERSGFGWFRPRKGTETDMVVASDPTPYIDMAGTDAMVRIEFPDGMRWEFLIELGNCWFEGAPPTKLIVTGPPDPGIPVVPCP